MRELASPPLPPLRRSSETGVQLYLVPHPAPATGCALGILITTRRMPVPHHPVLAARLFGPEKHRPSEGGQADNLLGANHGAGAA